VPSIHAVESSGSAAKTTTTTCLTLVPKHGEVCCVEVASGLGRLVSWFFPASCTFDVALHFASFSMIASVAEARSTVEALEIRAGTLRRAVPLTHYFALKEFV
jgi:hypothetical protein